MDLQQYYPIIERIAAPYIPDRAIPYYFDDCRAPLSLLQTLVQNKVPKPVAYATTLITLEFNITLKNLFLCLDTVQDAVNELRSKMQRNVYIADTVPGDARNLLMAMDILKNMDSLFGRRAQTLTSGRWLSTYKALLLLRKKEPIGNCRSISVICSILLQFFGIPCGMLIVSIKPYDDKAGLHAKVTVQLRDGEYVTFDRTNYDTILGLFMARAKTVKVYPEEYVYEHLNLRAIIGSEIEQQALGVVRLTPELLDKLADTYRFDKERMDLLLVKYSHYCSKGEDIAALRAIPRIVQKAKMKPGHHVDTIVVFATKIVNHYHMRKSVPKSVIRLLNDIYFNFIIIDREIYDELYYRDNIDWIEKVVRPRKKRKSGMIHRLFSGK